MIKAIIFDWGGVLAPDNCKAAAEKLAAIYKKDEKKLYQRLASLEDVFSTSQENNEYYKIIASEFNIPAEDVKEALNDVPATEVFQVAKNLSTKYKVYLLSDQMKEKTDHIRKNNDLSFFTEAWFSNEIRMSKFEGQAIFNFALDKIGFEAKECIFIDDNEKNIINAKKTGFNAILFRNKEQLLSELKPFGVLAE